MSNKILNWLAGGFFRKLGSMLVYIFIALIIGYFVSNSDIKLPFSDLLGIEKVSAATVPQWSDSLPALQNVIYRDCSGTNTCSTGVSISSEYFTTSSGNYRMFMVNTSSLTVASNGVSISSFVNSVTSGYLYRIDYYICSNKDLSLDRFSYSIYTNLYSTPGVNNNIYNVASRNALNVEVQEGSTPSFSYCGVVSGLVVPDSNYSWSTLRIKSSTSTSGVYYQLLATDISELGLYTDTIQTIVENAVLSSGVATSSDIDDMTTEISESQQETTDAVNDINDTLSDTDTSESSTDASDFLNGFSLDETDNITAIITLPLILINGIVNDNYSDLCTTYKNKEVCLPSGGIVWNSDSSLLDDFELFFNLVVGGFLSYKLLLSIVKSIRKMLDPVADAVEVMEL